MSTLSIKIGAVLDGSFNTVIKGSSSQLTRLGENIRKLDSSLKSVSKFKQLGHDVLTSKRSWKGFEDQVKSLAKQMKAIEKPSKTLKAEFDKAKTSATKAKEAYLKKRDALHSFNEEVRKSGRNIKSLVSDQYKLGSSIEVLKGKYSKLGSVIQKQQNALARKAHYRSQVMETIGLGLSLAAPIKVAIDFESAMADVKKVVRFAKDDAAHNQGAIEFGQTLKELSRTIPLSAAELAQIAASGGQLGIDKEELIGFTTTVAKMSTAFDMSAEEAGDSIAKLANVYGIKVAGMERVGNIINHLSDNSAAKAGDMVKALAIVGGTAKQFGLDIKETSSLVNAFISLGKQPAKAATAINALLSKLQTAEGQSKEFKAALEDMGITAEEMTQRIRENGQDALLYFFETLEKVDKQERSQILLNLFGQEYQDDIALLVGSLKNYKDAINNLADEKKFEKSMQEEFNNRAATTANNLRLLRNAIAEVGMNLGSVMLPPLKWMSSLLREITNPIARFAEKFPVITTGIMSVITALIGLKVLVVSGGYAWNLVRGGMLAFSVILHGVVKPALISLSSYAIPVVITGLSVLKATTLSLATKAFPLLSSALPAVAAGMRFLTAAIVSNPIGAIIALLASGAILVISNWQKVKGFFSSIWEYVKSIIKPIGEMFSWLGNTVGSIFGKVFENSPLKEFEKRKSIVTEIHTPLKSSILSNGNPLLNNSIIKEFSKRNKNSFRVKSLIEEKKSTESDNDKIFADFARSKFENKEQKTMNKTQNITNNYTISIKAEPNQDVRSLADEVIKRIREKSRDVMFDTVDPIY
ncbi:probable tape measure protein [Trichonephila clavata]|uniref:Probable tape measure protein n=1 Tax=Trichonephila clavata TaxID=2740835 RepID=A0A8X6H689_TRICU|nr:probable tape measure protein [Trichonephila clavata]GFR03912.1 probable tape measure protein [Trichonephila clavata]GFR17399.1 probable tape measure protein [Trichonephila clavata]GFR20646.1 probable tape measure protein [Trichonephila clavata]